MSFLVTALLGSVTVRTIQYALVVGVPLSLVSLEFYNASSVVAQMHGAWPKWEPFDFVACIIVVGGLVAFHFYEEPGVVAETPKLNNYAADERRPLTKESASEATTARVMRVAMIAK